MAALQRADLSDRDEFGALAPDEERHERDASVMRPESGRQRELLKVVATEFSSINRILIIFSALFFILPPNLSGQSLYFSSFKYS